LIYLIIIVALAAAGIARLWLLQRRQQSKIFSVAEFREGLDKIAAPTKPSTPVEERRPVAVARPRAARPTQPLDPARREAAKRRLEERRARRVRPTR
jgi:hypothetical protein